MTHRFGSWDEPDDDPADYPPWEDDGEADYEAECEALDAVVAGLESLELVLADDLGAYFDRDPYTGDMVWMTGRFEPCGCEVPFNDDEGELCRDCGNSGWVLA